MTVHRRVVALALLGSACGGGGASLGDLTVSSPTCTTEVTWQGEPSGDIPGPEVPASPKGIAIYVDVSSPMGGYLAADARGPSDLRRLLTVAPEVLGDVYADDTFDWSALSERLVPTTRSKLLARDAYRGGSSPLAGALGAALERVVRGEVNAAVIVTDLVATGDARTGGGEAGAGLRAWLESSQARSGRFGLGLLGLHASYAGVAARGCASLPGLGCRFSEDLDRWLPLAEPTRIPLYAVVIGADLQRVDQAGRRLVAELDGTEPQWDLLGGGAVPPSVALTCDLRRTMPGVTGPIAPMEAKLMDGEVMCLRDVDLAGTCQVTVDRPPLSIRGLRGSWPRELASFTVTGADRVGMTLHCGAIRDSTPPSGPLDVVFDLDPTANGADWSTWSTSTDDDDASIGRTLNLRYFTDAVRVRPVAWRTTCGGVLPPIVGAH